MVRRRRVEPDAVVGDGERQAPVRPGKRDRHLRGFRVLRDVLKGLEAREVDGRFDVLGAPTHVARLDRHRDGGLPRLRFQRGGQALVREERRVDPAREVTEIVERARGVGLDLPRHLACLHRVPLRQLFQQTELHGERHQLLLRAVVDVALQAPPLFVLRADQPLPGRPELLDQSDVPEHQARLGGEVAHEPLLRRVDRVVRRHRDRQRAEELALVADLDGRVRRQLRDLIAAE